jgi:hypothetical protein
MRRRMRRQSHVRFQVHLLFGVSVPRIMPVCITRWSVLSLFLSIEGAIFRGVALRNLRQVTGVGLVC